MLLRSLGLVLLISALAVGCQSQSREEMMSQGLKLASEGNNKGAAVVFANILEKHPGDQPAALALAEAYLKTGKPQQAASVADKVLAKAPDSTQALLIATKAKLAERDPESAQAIIEKVLSSPNPPSEAWELSGQCHFLKARYGEAMSDFEKAIAASPSNIPARAALVECLIAMGDNGRAQIELDALLAANPANKEGLYLQAQLQTRRGEEDALIATFAAITKHHPLELRARFAEAYLRLTRNNDVEFARKKAASLMETFKNSPEGYKLQGLVFMATQDPQQAVEPLLKALRLRPDVDTNIHLAQAYSALGNDETAINHIQAALTQAPDLVVPRRMLAAIYLKQKRLDEALAETGRIFKTNPADVQGQAIMAEALLAKRDYDKGLAAYEELARNKADNPDVYLKKGMLLALKGKDAEAEADLRKAVELGGDALEPRLYLSSFLAGKKRLDEAAEALQGTRQGASENALALNAMAKLRLRQGRLAEALELLHKAKAADPGLLMTYYNLAALSIATGKPEEAGRQFDEALAQSPADIRALLGAAAAREAKGEYDKALTFYTRASATGLPQGALALAEYHLRRDDKARALLILDECLSKSPDALALWLLKSRVHANLGEHDKALAALSRVETMNQPLGLRERVKYYLAVKNKEKAMEAANRLRDINPRAGEYSLPLAEVQEITGDREAARRTLDRALREDPKSQQALMMLSGLEAKEGRYPQALALLDRAALAGMNPAAANTMKGMIRQQAGDPDGAARDYETALRHDERQVLALNNLSVLYADKAGNAGEALELAMRAYAMEPHNAAVLDTLGYALLKNGRAKEAMVALREANRLMPGNAEISRHLESARVAGEDGKP